MKVILFWLQSLSGLLLLGPLLSCFAHVVLTISSNCPVLPGVIDSRIYNA